MPDAAGSYETVPDANASWDSTTTAVSDIKVEGDWDKDNEPVKEISW